MARAGDQNGRTWTMRVEFEPTRLRAAPLAAAYEAVLPVSRRRPSSGADPASEAVRAEHDCCDERRA